MEVPETNVDMLFDLEKFHLKKTIGITGWILRSIDNCQKKEVRGTLSTSEWKRSTQYWIKKIQYRDEIVNDKFQELRENLGLEKNENGIFVCKGRIQGVHPIYLPKNSVLSEKIIHDAHYKTLHGGVGLTITKVREQYWIPTLRSLAKKIIKRCSGCKRFTTRPFQAQTTGQLPKDRTEGERPFQIVGLDYAGPLICKKNGKEKKTYIMVISDSLSRALYLELLHDQTLEEFLKCLKRFIARRGRPEVIYSDNFSTFSAADRWLKKILKTRSYMTT